MARVRCSALRAPSNAETIWRVSSGQLPFLRQLAPEDADALLARVRRRTLAPGPELIRAGWGGDTAIRVLAGRVRLVATGADNRQVVLALRGPGELLGEMAALGGGRRIASAIALESVDVGFLDASELQSFLREHPDAAIVLVR